MKAVISGIGSTIYGNTEGVAAEIAADAVGQAVEDAGLTPSEIDAIVVGNFSAEVVEGQGSLAAMVAAEAGIRDVYGMKVEGACASGAMALELAVRRVEAGDARAAVAVGIDAMKRLSTDERTAVIGGASDQRTEGAAGLTFVGLFALMARAYMHRHSIDARELHRVAEHNWMRGRANPIVERQREYTLEAYLESPMIASPLRSPDCCSVSNGASAVVVTNNQVNESVPGSVPILSVTVGLGSSSLTDMQDLSGFSVVRTVTKSALSQAEVVHNDVNVLELHDAFTISQLLDLEDMGFYPEGKALDFLAHADELFVNPSGGLLSRGHPIAATALAQVYELVLQARGQSHWQHPDPRIGMAQSVGGAGAYAAVTILNLGSS